MLEEKDVVRDVLKFPPHSKDSPESIGSCRSNGKEMDETIIAVLDNRAGTADLPARTVWKIDEAGKRFVTISVEGLLCSRDGVITTGGGR